MNHQICENTSYTRAHIQTQICRVTYVLLMSNKYHNSNMYNNNTIYVLYRELKIYFIMKRVVNRFVFSFITYLKDGNIIVSYSSTVDS